MWYDNAGERSIFSLMVSSLPAEVLQVLQYMYRVHDPAITIAIGSVWLQLSWKRGKTNSLVPDDGYLQVPRKKKLHVQLVYVGDEFKMWKKNVCYVFVTDDSWVYRTMRKYKWNRQTDIQQTSCHSNQSQQIEIHACTSKYVIFSTKKGIGMYKCTRKLQLQQNIFKPHPHFLPALTSS